MKKTIFLPKPNEAEKERMEEVKFFLFVNKATRAARGAGLDDQLAFIRPAIAITNTSENLIMAAVKEIMSIAAKPHELEVAVTAKFMKYPYLFVEKNLMHSRKYQTLLMEYRDNKDMNELLPKLPEELTSEIIKFNREMYDKVTPIFAFLHCEFTYREIGQWDS
jgi:hypothetical protein